MTEVGCDGRGMADSSGRWIAALARGTVMNTRLANVHIVSLGEIATEDKVNEFLDRLVAMVES